MVTHPDRVELTENINPGREHEAAPFVLLNGVAWGILLPNDTLYRAPETMEADPYGRQPTVWMTADQAQSERDAITVMLDTWYGIESGHPTTELRVVRLELDAEGIWSIPVPDRSFESYRPTDPDTGKLAAMPCSTAVDLTIEQARTVMREHRACAGQITCRIRGRARALLAREGVMQLVSPARAENVWQSLDLPERAGR